ncbi:AMP-binding protein [Novipirellula aureliae]|uniref:AMP-binding protein n=1 Tax=Novipirellula aureliae TaxID=2527966 RepID=UPI0018CEA923|nr:AMP-binding protein [Novipirellula aureliae]
MADSTGLELSGGRLLAASLVLRRVLIRSGIANSAQSSIGILLPPSVAAVLANLAVAFAGKTVVNLNYTFKNDRAQHCVTQCAITHVLTSRRFLKRRPFELSAEMIFVEDLAKLATWWDRLLCIAAGYLLPVTMLGRMLGLDKNSDDDLMAILFTSGTTTLPKGVMLSHGNIDASLNAIRNLYRVNRDDVTIGILPFFHAFGYSGTLWLPLVTDMAAVYHVDPFGSKEIGKLARRYKATVLFATPTFLKMYLRRCDADDFANLELAIVGAERLDPMLAKSFSEKFKATAVEGYGTTETSPWISVNVPASRTLQKGVTGDRSGTVGRPVPGVQVKVVDPESQVERPIGCEGLLLAHGANVMLGYWMQPQMTAEVLHDGWYNTGDFAKQDADGFITITGRQSRFSKLGGEMVPHEAVENAINQIVAPNADEGLQYAAVTAIPDTAKGERLIVIHTPPIKYSPTEIVQQLTENEFPPLWIPKPADFIEVNELPMTSMGKIDLGALKQIATTCGRFAEK